MNRMRKDLWPREVGLLMRQPFTAVAGRDGDGERGIQTSQGSEC